MKRDFRILIRIAGILGLFLHSVMAEQLPRRSVLGAAVIVDPRGLRITAVTPDSPASASGLKAGDVITEIGDHKAESPAAFAMEVHATSVQQPFRLTLLRDGIQRTVDVQLTSAPQESDSKVDTIYSSIDVDGSKRRTLVTVPKNSPGKLPAMLLMGGIGCFTVDNPSDPFDGYRLLAHGLSRAGIVVMRVEKSGIGDSQGGPCFDTDFNHESRSYEVALDALFSDPHVDSKRIFLFGHSIGTLIAPRIADRRSLAGIIIADGVGINWVEYELANLRRQATLDGDSPAETDALLRSKEVCMHRLLIEHQAEDVIEQDMPECKARNVYPVAPPYVQQVAALNIAESWTRMNLPVLAIYGTADFVTTESDHERIVAIVNSKHPGTAQFQTVEGMDHHFALMGSPQRAYDTRVKAHHEGPYAEKLTAVVAQWICAKTRCGEE